jgi:hypothetical protein
MIKFLFWLIVFAILWEIGFLPFILAIAGAGIMFVGSMMISLAGAF